MKICNWGMKKQHGVLVPAGIDHQLIKFVANKVDLLHWCAQRIDHNQKRGLQVCRTHEGG